mgnify:CR=1 FL=1
MIEYQFVTTMNMGQYHAFGKNMITSMNAYLPDNACLDVYIDDCNDFEDLVAGSKINYIEFDLTNYNVFKFMARPNEKSIVTEQRNTAKYDSELMFKWDATRFGYKVYALFEAIQQPKARHLVWIDADTKLTKKIDNDFLPSLLNEGDYMAYLARRLTHSECGFLLWDTWHESHYYFWNAMSGMYKGLQMFNEQEWHDSYIFDRVRLSLENWAFVGNTKIHEIDRGHVWNESRLKTEAGMEHYKGPLDGK